MIIKIIDFDSTSIEVQDDGKLRIHIDNWPDFATDILFKSDAIKLRDFLNSAYPPPPSKPVQNNAIPD